MARIDRRVDVSLDSPALVEGFPGVGLVGKIVADHLIEELGMVHYANVHCEALPPVTTYRADSSELMTPVRLYADADHDLLALQSDVPINPRAANAFADCVTDWGVSESVLPIYISGLPRQIDDDEPDLYGVSAGDGGEWLSAAGIDTPAERGIVSGPTGALLAHALDTKTTAVGLIAESDPQFPDPAAARVVIEQGIEPIAGVDIETADLTERAGEIKAARNQLLKRIQQASEESSRAEPIRMYQ